MWFMRSIGYLVYLLLHSLFDMITVALNGVSTRVRQGEQRTIEKETLYPNSISPVALNRGARGKSCTLCQFFFNSFIRFG